MNLRGSLQSVASSQGFLPAGMDSWLSPFKSDLTSGAREITLDFFKAFDRFDFAPSLNVNLGESFDVIASTARQELQRAGSRSYRLVSNVGQKVEQAIGQSHPLELAASGALLYFSLKDLHRQYQSHCNPKINDDVRNSDPDRYDDCKKVLVEIHEKYHLTVSEDRVYFVDSSEGSGFSLSETPIWTKRNKKGELCCYIDSKLATSYVQNTTSDQQLKGIAARSLSYASKAKSALHVATVAFTVMKPLMSLESLTRPLGHLAEHLVPVSIKEAASPLLLQASRLHEMISIVFIPSFAFAAVKWLLLQTLDYSNLHTELSYYSQSELDSVISKYEESLRNNRQVRGELHENAARDSIVLHNSRAALSYLGSCIRVIPGSIGSGLSGVKRAWRESPTDFKALPVRSSVLFQEAKAVNYYLRSVYYTTDGRAWLVDWGASSNQARYNMAKRVLSERAR